MKKLLLLSCAFAACVGASAQQQLQKAPVTAQLQKVSELSAAKVVSKVAPKAKAPKKVSRDSFIGLFINNAWEEEQECNLSTVDTMFTANVTSDEGVQLNVKWGVYSNFYGGVYGRFDEATNTFTVPAFQYCGDGAPVQVTDEEASPVFFAGVSTNNRYCDFVAQYDPATGILTPNDTIQGYQIIIAEGTYQNYYVTRNFAPFIARANAVQSGYYTGDDSWEDIVEWPVYMDFTALEDGVVDVYNVYLTGQAGWKASMDVDGSDVSMATGQPMLYITSEANRQLFGNWVLLRGVALDEAEGTIRMDMDMPTIEGGQFNATTGEVSFQGVYYRGCSEINNDRAFITPFYAHSTFTPNVPIDPNGISGVATKGEKAIDNRIFNLAGQQVDKNYKGVVIQNGVKKLQK